MCAKGRGGQSGKGGRRMGTNTNELMGKTSSVESGQLVKTPSFTEPTSSFQYLK